MSDKILGWSEGRSMARCGDGTGIFHLILCDTSQPGHAIAYAACNRNLSVFGGLEETKRGHKCKRCEAIAKRLAIIPVVFRVGNGANDDVFALFPTDCADNTGNYCGCYQHIGQHCAADYHRCIQDSRPAKPTEYADLKTELERIGYTLRVIRRASPAHHEARRQESAALNA